jgi:hypothetical protein
MLVLLLLEVAKRFAKLLLTIIFFVGLAGEGGVCTAIVSLINAECKAVMARTGGDALFFKDGLNSKVGYLFIIKNINPTYEKNNYIFVDVYTSVLH